jgi:hypothetical protein
MFGYARLGYVSNCSLSSYIRENMLQSPPPASARLSRRVQKLCGIKKKMKPYDKDFERKKSLF